MTTGSPLSVMIGMKPTGLDQFVAQVKPIGIYCLNNIVSYPGVKTVYRVQNSTDPGEGWDRLPDVCGIERYFEKEDPIASADYELLYKTIYVPGHGNLNLIEYWQLSPADWYAPYNEWVLDQGPDAILKAQFMNAWTCRALEIAHAYGLALCIGSFATGNPDFALLPQLYPMFRLAKQLKGLCDVHEYGDAGALMAGPPSGALRYRELRAHLPADCQLDMIDSEFWWGNGVEENNIAAQVTDAAAYGREIVKDHYMLWASAFQLDDGAENRFTPDGLALYAAAAAQIQRTVEDEGEIDGMSPQIYGIHSRANGGDLTAIDLSVLGSAGNKLNGVKFTTQDARSNHELIRQTGIDPANCAVRIYWDPGGITVLPSPADFFAQVVRLPQAEAIEDGITTFEFLNEPNITTEWKWSPAEFVTFAKEVITLMRQNTTADLTILSPGLAPDAATVGLWDQAFAEGGLYAACDGIGAHAYGAQPAHLNDPDQLRYYRRFIGRLTGTQKIWITEMSFKYYSITPYEVGRLYGELCATLEPEVQAVYFFILQGDGFAASGEEWVTYTDIALGLADYAPSTVHYRYDHSHLDGGAAMYQTPITIVMNQDHTLEVDAVEVIDEPARFHLTVTIRPPGSLIVVLNPPQPPEGYVIGTIVTATPAVPPTFAHRRSIA